MKTVSMSGSLRENVGKKDAKKARREGKIPCVLYGGKEQVHFTLGEKEFSKIIFTPEVFVLNISINGTSYKAILQDVQYHPVTDVILHVDLLQVIDGKPVIIGVPVIFTGTAPGILKGGRLRKRLNKLLVKGLVDDLPEHIEISISDLDLNDSIKVKDITFANLEFMESPGTEIVGVKTARGAGMGDEPEEEEEEGVEAAEGEETTGEGEESSTEKSAEGEA
jgi:large subunit ribosomal protein L25